EDAGPLEAVAGKGAICSRSRRYECCGIEPVIDRFVSGIRIDSGYEIRNLGQASLRSQRAIDARCHGEKLRRSDLDDWRKLPTATNQLQCPAREARRLKHRRQIEHVPLISGLTVGAVGAPVARKVETIQQVVPIVADAMRPRMVCENTHSTAQPLLNREKQAV